MDCFGRKRRSAPIPTPSRSAPIHYATRLARIKICRNLEDRIVAAHRCDVTPLTLCVDHRLRRANFHTAAGAGVAGYLRAIVARSVRLGDLAQEYQGDSTLMRVA